MSAGDCCLDIGWMGERDVEGMYSGEEYCA